MRHFLAMTDLTPAEIERVFSIAEDLKAKFQDGLREPLLPGRVMALLFEKKSLRTRVSFEAAMAHLGGTTLFLGQDVGWGKRESANDFSQVLSQYVDVVVCRFEPVDHSPAGATFPAASIWACSSISSITSPPMSAGAASTISLI